MSGLPKTWAEWEAVAAALSGVQTAPEVVATLARLPAGADILEAGALLPLELCAVPDPATVGRRAPRATW